eukprot:362917-Chlamydomonas_euryale.AAC.7
MLGQAGQGKCERMPTAISWLAYAEMVAGTSVPPRPMVGSDLPDDQASASATALCRCAPPPLPLHPSFPLP